MSPLKSLVLLSGGLDSAVLLAWRITEGDTCVALSFDYNQRHRAELSACDTIAEHYGVQHIRQELAPLPVNPEHPSVWGRNSAFAVYAAAHALQCGAGKVYIGATADDYAEFPDCRPAYFGALNATFATIGGPVVDTPFANRRKAEIVTLGLSLGAPLELTLTCYEGTRPACGACMSCRGRLAAFAAAASVDPIPYMEGTRV